MKAATSFTPRRVWKKKRRDRNIQRRRNRKRWYQRNKSKLRTKRRQRYKQLRKNPTWKRWQTKLRHEKVKRHMTGSIETHPLFGIPVSEEGVWVGLLLSLDMDADVVRARSVRSGRDVVIPLQFFLENAGFADVEFERVFWTTLEVVYGQDETA